MNIKLFFLFFLLFYLTFSLSLNFYFSLALFLFFLSLIFSISPINFQKAIAKKQEKFNQIIQEGTEKLNILTVFGGDKEFLETTLIASTKGKGSVGLPERYWRRFGQVEGD